jgi:hypothetical protein
MSPDHSENLFRMFRWDEPPIIYVLEVRENSNPMFKGPRVEEEFPSSRPANLPINFRFRPSLNNYLFQT